ncbi:NADPH-dependent oxidoreductase [Patescibacteria group bacterium]|nr:MAG: NADPH-dependent oxidoreductase [Patescibacteria group bacterium]
MTKIAVIVGATREGRVTDKLASWVAKEVAVKASVEVLDLRDYPLPFFDEPVSPRYNPARTPAEAVKKWLEKVNEFDGYVMVTPEYNRSTSGVLKNAIDVLAYEMDNKPVALVAHGSAGGGQAISALRTALPGVGAVTLPQALYFTDAVGQAIDDEGILKAELIDNPYGPQASLVGLVDSLVKYSEALMSVRG